MTIDITRRGALFALAGSSLASAACVQTVRKPAASPATSGLEFPGPSQTPTVLALLDRQVHLRTGSSGEFVVGDRIEAAIRDAGCDVTRQAVDVLGFDSDVCELIWDTGRVDVFPQFGVVATPPGGVRAELMLWRDERDTAQVTGRIALVMLARRRHSRLDDAASRKPLNAVLAGNPAAVVLITDGPTGETIILNANSDGPCAPVPLAVLGPKPGAGAMAAALNGQRGNLVISGKTVQRRSYNIIGTRDGKGPMLAASTPRTGWTPAVAERGPGLAAFIDLIRWAPDALPGRQLFFVCTTAHEFDNRGGHFLLNSPLAPAIGEVGLWVHFGAGFAARSYHDLGDGTLLPLLSPDDQRFVLGTEVLMPALRKAFAGQPGLEAAYPLSGAAQGELSELYRHGYPNLFGLFSGHPFHHSMLDRAPMTDPEWIDAASLAARQVVASVFAQP